MLRKLKLVTDGIIDRAKILDENNNVIGIIDEIIFKSVKPLTLVKVGNENYRPTPEDLNKIREIFEEAYTEDKFTVFANSDISVETIYPRGNVEIKLNLSEK